MSEDSFTEVTSESLFSRLGKSIVGIVVGIILFLVSFPMLFLNEGRAVKRAKTLKSGLKSVISADANIVDKANEGKLVHLTSTAKTKETLKDKMFGLSANALQLNRKVEMYQWEEVQTSESKKKVGGGTETVTKYSYKKVWSDDHISSDNFKKPKGHKNPQKISMKNREYKAENVTLGAFTLSESIKSQITKSESISLKKVPELKTKRKVQLNGGGAYVGKSPDSPKVGDLRISFSVVKAQEISVIAMQRSNIVEPFITKHGNIQLVSYGNVGYQAMFEQAKQGNVIMTWILRFLGIFLMFIGLTLVFNPLSVLADIIPIIGTVVGAGTTIIALLLTLPLSFITIAVAWIVYRPLLGILLLVISGGAIYLVKTKLSSGAEAVPAAE